MKSATQKGNDVAEAYNLEVMGGIGPTLMKLLRDLVAKAIEGHAAEVQQRLDEAVGLLQWWHNYAGDDCDAEFQPMVEEFLNKTLEGVKTVSPTKDWAKMLAKEHNLDVAVEASIRRIVEMVERGSRESERESILKELQEHGSYGHEHESFGDLVERIKTKPITVGDVEVRTIRVWPCGNCKRDLICAGMKYVHVATLSEDCALKAKPAN